VVPWTREFLQEKKHCQPDRRSFQGLKKSTKSENSGQTDGMVNRGVQRTHGGPKEGRRGRTTSYQFTKNQPHSYRGGQQTPTEKTGEKMKNYKARSLGQTLQNTADRVEVRMAPVSKGKEETDSLDREKQWEE